MKKTACHAIEVRCKLSPKTKHKICFYVHSLVVVCRCDSIARANCCSCFVLFSSLFRQAFTGHWGCYFWRRFWNLFGEEGEQAKLPSFAPSRRGPPRESCKIKDHTHRLSRSTGDGELFFFGECFLVASNMFLPCTFAAVRLCRRTPRGSNRSSFVTHIQLHCSKLNQIAPYQLFLTSFFPF